MKIHTNVNIIKTAYMKSSYDHLIGKTKKEIIQEIGEEFNFYPAHVWTYTIKKKWFYKNTVLHIYFDGEIVIHTFVRSSFKL